MYLFSDDLIELKCTWQITKFLFIFYNKISDNTFCQIDNTTFHINSFVPLKGPITLQLLKLSNLRKYQMSRIKVQGDIEPGPRWSFREKLIWALVVDGTQANTVTDGGDCTFLATLSIYVSGDGMTTSFLYFLNINIVKI